MRLVIAFATLACLLAPCGGLAEERARMLWSRGLVEFDGGRYQQALDLFQQAVDADPEDMHARYYRAVARARLNDLDGAIADLRAVLAAQPDFDEAALDLGVALIERREYTDAIPWLAQAQRAPALETRASLFLGIAQLRSMQLAPARESFSRATRDPQQRLAALYYRGLVSFQQADNRAAEADFAAVVEEQPDSAIGREARAFLDKLRGVGQRWYALYAELGLAYDSNVVLASSADAGGAESVLGVSQKADGLGIISAGGFATPWRNDVTAFSLGYDFYQSYYFELVEFDLQNHAPSLQVATEIGRFFFGVLGRYDYALLDTQSFVQSATAWPWLTISEGEIGRLELFYRMTRRDYKQVSFSVRDAFNHAVGATQFVHLGSAGRFLSFGYQFDREDPVVSQRLVANGAFTKDQAEGYAYNGNQVSVGIAAPLPLDVSGESTVVYRYERFASESALSTPSGHRRHDNDVRLSLALRRPLWQKIDLIGDFFAEFSDSNNPEFEYDRQVVSLAIEARY